MVASKKNTGAADEGETLPEQPVQIDPNTGEPYEEASGPGSQVAEVGKSDPTPGIEVADDEEWFGVAVNERGILQVRPKDWVGPPPLEIHASKVDALISALQKAKKAKVADVNEEYEFAKDPNGQVFAEQKTPHQS